MLKKLPVTLGILVLLGIATVSAVKAATTQTSCIVTIFGKQYDITSLQNSHTGGNIFTCGTDMTVTYQSIHGSDTSRMALYLVVTATPSPTPTPTPSSSPTPTPTGTPLPTATPSPVTSPTPSPKPSEKPHISTDSGSIKDDDDNDDDREDENENENRNKNHNNENNHKQKEFSHRQEIFRTLWKKFNHDE